MAKHPKNSKLIGRPKMIEFSIQDIMLEQRAKRQAYQNWYAKNKSVNTSEYIKRCRQTL
jgi:hypothetical protein